MAIIDSHLIAEIGTVEEIFARPKSQAARRLFYPEGKQLALHGDRCCRIVFDGNSASEPVIADMVLRFRTTVNILFADTKNIDGKAFGQIVIQLPQEEGVADRMIEYLKAKGLAVEEVEGFV